MAKRSVRRARRQGVTTGDHALSTRTLEPARPAFRTRHFWLGALAAACLLIPVAVLAAVLASGDEAQPTAERAAATPTPDPSVEREIERLRRVTQTRDKEQVEELTNRMRKYSDELRPVVAGLAKTLPPGRENAVGPLADEDEVDKWIRRTHQAREFFEESVSGDTGTNVARGAFAAAVRSLAEVAQTYKLALDEPAARAALLERVRAQRDLATRAWDTASVQIDAINIAAGFGHQHVPGLGAGGVPPDSLPEGTDATEPAG